MRSGVWVTRRPAWLGALPADLRGLAGGPQHAAGVATGDTAILTGNDSNDGKITVSIPKE